MPMTEASSSLAREILPPAEARQKSAENLEKIAAALLAYVEAKKSLPDPASTITRGETEVALLSWRVTLLPFLGYEALHKQFRLNEPWNSPHNKKLLAQIPPEFQSPDRIDVRTNYVLPVGHQTAYSQGRGRVPANFTAGPENVIMLLEADDSHAVPWTAPQDLSYEAATPRVGIGSLRQDGTLVALANGVVGMIANAVTDAQLREAFTIDEDSVPAGTLVKSTEVTISAGTAVVADGNLPPMALDTSRIPNTAPATGDAAFPKLSELPKPTTNDPARLRIPDDRDVQVARTVLRDLYRQDYENAKTPAARQELVKRMIVAAVDAGGKPAEAYELLRVAREMAVANGLVDEAVEADQALAERFDVDGLAMRAKTLDELRKRTRDSASATKLMSTAMLLIREALEEDQHSSAVQASEVYMATHRLAGKGGRGSSVELLREAIEATQKAYADVPQAMQALQRNPSDAVSNTMVGKYYCLVKQRWDEFLPMLAKGDELKLRVIATIDLESPTDTESILQLADQYWDMADDYAMPYKLGLRLRAIHYYNLASKQPSGGLAGIRARKRLQEWHAQPEWVRVFAPIAAAEPAADPDE